MAAASVLAPTATADDSTAIVCTGAAKITVGLYTASNVPITEHVGAVVYIENGVGPVLYRDKNGHVVKLTDNCPMVQLEGAGSYTVSKGATTQEIGVWADTGA